MFSRLLCTVISPDCLQKLATIFNIEKTSELIKKHHPPTDQYVRLTKGVHSHYNREEYTCLTPIVNDINTNVNRTTIL